MRRRPPGGFRPGPRAGSAASSHGALGAFAFGIGATEMASVWSLGVALNVEVPRTIKVEVHGRFAPKVGPKDLILHLVGLLTAEGANFRVIEFHGETIHRMPTSGRLTLCNMTVEAGATSGVIPGDEETTRYLRDVARVRDPVTLVTPDPDAVYERTIEVDASSLAPLVAKLGDVSTDVIYPGRYMATVLPNETPQYAFADNAELNRKLNSKQVPPAR